MEKSLRRKLTLSHVFVAVVCALLISIVANIFLEKQFKNYVINVRERKSEDIVYSISHQYSMDDKWNYYRVESIGIDALENGLIINVHDMNGKVIWDANIYNNGKCEDIIAHMSQNMMKRYSDWKGKYIENKYDIEYDSKKVGSVTIGYYGPFYYNDNDMIFLNTLNKIFGIVGIVSMFMALILGILMAGRMSKPISRVIETSENISNGNYNERISEKSDIIEINRLISTINNLAQRLQEHEAMQKRLTADVSHELRTPLTTLQSHIEAILDGIWEPTQERMKSCHEEILRINRLVKDLEKLSIYENENLTLNKSNFDISDVIKNIVLNFESEYINKNIIMKIECDENQMIFGDKDKISQVCVNLISNALKYTVTGGKVEISVKGELDYIELSIKDNGIGIAKEDLPYIFERFYRADKSRNRLTGGAGIGLTITKTIVEAHKGKIFVNSKLGEGTQFSVFLPKNI
ncbi:HAMP domain-containing sensor histidine kinase [Clostridium aestuarii]|uniref:histidine kinase n=1 Tax=Clostridium aestuarii TaxID=338193 RepID=A0ABT4D6E8_9CLOT|nr:HAMP domain-containing sensor histidine kinase [Clostridium aestuarii]MCY6485573.1 HAMP domain-containing sensor histidine kinase [Clostridium aestuarii]